MAKYTRLACFTSVSFNAVKEATQAANKWIQKMEKTHNIVIKQIDTCWADSEYAVTLVVEGEKHSPSQKELYATDALLKEILGEAA